MSSSTAYSMSVAANIRAEVARRGATQQQLATAIGISQQAVSRRLTGDVAFDVDELEAAARFLDVPVERLFSAT